MPDREIKPLLEKITDGSERVRDAIRTDLKGARDSRGDQSLGMVAEDMVTAAKRLRGDYRADGSSATDVEDLLRRAYRVERGIFANPRLTRSRDGWSGFKQLLEQIAFAFHTGWNGEGNVSRAFRMSDHQIESRVDAIREGASRLRKDLNQFYKSNRAADWRTKDAALVSVQDLEETSHRMSGRIDDQGAGTSEMNEMMRLGKGLQRFFLKEILPTNLRDEWRDIQNLLNDLSVEYRLPRL